MGLLLLFSGGAAPVNHLDWTEVDDTWILSGVQRTPRIPTLRRELVWTHDLEGEQNGAIGHDIIEVWTDERLDQSEQLGLELPADHAKATLLAADLELRYRGRRYYITELETTRRGTESTIRVEADALWYRLGDLIYPGSFIIESMTPSAGLQLILRETGWVSGPSTTSSATDYSFEQQDRTRLQLLRLWAKVTTTALVFNTAERSVDLVDVRGADLGLAFRYARNLTSVRRRVRAPELTVLYPYGADDLTVAGINGGVEYLEDFTYYTDQGVDLDTARDLYTRSRIWADSSFVRDVDLLPAAEARLATEAQPIISYELDVVDLSEITGTTEDVGVADRVRVYDPDFGDDIAATVTRVRRYRMEPWRNRIELSTILDPVTDPTSSGSRGSRSDEWIQFVGPVSAEYQIRNDGDYITNRIALRFREGGRANFHLDLNAVGVGDGVMHIEVVDANNADAQQFYELDVAYLDGEPVRALLQWATEDLSGSYDFRVRVTTVADGGPDPADGVDIAADAGSEASFWIMAQGAVQETPTASNSERFEFTGAIQYFTVPDGVGEVDIEVAGGGAGTSSGAIVTHSRFVTPGDVIDVYVGGPGVYGTVGPGAWPNGGDGGTAPASSNHGSGGAGSSDVRPSGGVFADAYAVAGGAGGFSEPSGEPLRQGGDGGFLTGGDGVGIINPGLGATQSAGGLGGDTPLGDGSFGQGGDAEDGLTSNSFPGGGGGGGWYGGGGSGAPAGAGSVNGAGGAGAGSGWVGVGGFDITGVDGGNAADAAGYVEFRWETST